MGLTAFSFVVLPLCLIWVLRPERLLQLMMTISVFEAAAAVTVGDLGVQPGLLPALTFIGFISLQLLVGGHYPGEALAWRVNTPFVLVTLYAVISSFLMPRLFEGEVFVWPQKASPPFVLTALQPNSANFNQDFYLLINCTFLVLASIFITKTSLHVRSFINAFLFGGILAIIVAIWQFSSKIAGVPYPDSFFYSNPGWAVLTAQQIGSVPRINGPFSEPSSLGGYMVSIMCSTGWLMLQGNRDRLVQLLFIASIFTAMLSTSTTGLGVLAIVGVGAPSWVLARGSARMAAELARITLPLLFVVGAIVFAATIWSPSLLLNASEVVIATMDKPSSSSYEDRTSADVDSLKAAVDTFGLGTGWGSNRSSSLVPGLLASIGVPGTLGLAWFAASIVKLVKKARRISKSSDEIFVIDGCCGALVGFLLGALLSAPTITSVTFFFLLALLIGCAVRVTIDGADLISNGRVTLLPARVTE